MPLCSSCSEDSRSSGCGRTLWVEYTCRQCEGRFTNKDFDGFKLVVRCIHCGSGELDSECVFCGGVPLSAVA